MPNREYVCDKCGHTFEVYQPLHDKLLKKCPSCKANKLYQNLMGITGQVREVKSLAQLAERNNKKLGKLGLEARIHNEQESIKKTQREAARKASEKFGMECIAKCDLPEPSIKPLDKKVKKNLFTGTKKEQAQKIKKYIEKGE